MTPITAKDADKISRLTESTGLEKCIDIINRDIQIMAEFSRKIFVADAFERSKTGKKCPCYESVTMHEIIGRFNERGFTVKREDTRKNHGPEVSIAWPKPQEKQQ